MSITEIPEDFYFKGEKKKEEKDFKKTHEEDVIIK